MTVQQNPVPCLGEHWYR